MATTAGGTAKTSEKDADGLRVDVQSLSKERAKLSETRRELERKMENLELLKRKVEDQERDTAEQLRSVRRQEEEVRLNLLPVGNRLKDVCSDVEVENAQRLLDKLLPDVWEKILDHLDENDLFPLALSCRYFRQKQKELVARTGQNGPESRESRLALKTNLLRKLAFCHQSKPSLDLRRFKESQPASAEYLRFCSKEKVSKDNILRAHPEDVVLEKALSVRCLAAFHGHLPLLQELLRSDNTLDPKNLVARNAGESPSSQSPLLLCFGF